MDSIVVALIGAAGTIVAAVITAGAVVITAQGSTRPRESDANRNGSEPKSSSSGGEPPPKPEQQPGGATTAKEPEADAEEAEEFDSLDGSEPQESGGAESRYIPVPCPHCGRRIRIYGKMWLLRVRCKVCGAVFRPRPIGKSELLIAGTIGETTQSKTKA